MLFVEYREKSIESQAEIMRVRDVTDAMRNRADQARDRADALTQTNEELTRQLGEKVKELEEWKEREKAKGN